MKTEPRKQFTFYQSYYDAIHRLPKRDQSAIILAVCAYALYEIEPSGLSGTASACFALIRPTLDAGRRKAKNGRKSRPGSKPQANQEQIQSKTDSDLELEFNKEYECTSVENGEDAIVDQIIGLYHSLCPDLPPCQILSPNTQHAICSRWAEYPKIEVFHKVFSSAQRSNLLTRKQVNWRASLGWLMDRNHFAKVYNGCYDNTSAQDQAVPTGGSGVLGEAEQEAIQRVLCEASDMYTPDEIF